MPSPFPASGCATARRRQSRRQQVAEAESEEAKSSDAQQVSPRWAGGLAKLRAS